MAPPTDDPPSWLAWMLFVSVSLGWAIDKFFTLKKTRADTRKIDYEMCKLRLDALIEASETRRSQLVAIADVLRAEHQPSEADIEALAQSAPMSDVTRSVVEHLRSRRKARAALPQVMTDIANLQRQAEDVRKELALGLLPGDSAATLLFEELAVVDERLGEIIRDVAASPRIYVTDEGAPPPPPDWGNLWIVVPKQADETPGPTPEDQVAVDQLT